MERLERYVVYPIALVLAIVVVILVLKDSEDLKGSEEECPEDWETCIESADGLSSACFLQCMRDFEVDHLTAQITQAKNEIIGDHRVVAHAAALMSIASTPLLFDNARTDGEGELHEGSHGVALQPGHTDQLRRIADVFKGACPQPQNVRLRVVGSFSRASFRGQDPDKSDELNLQAAELRASAVAPAMKEALAKVGLGDVSVNAVTWQELLPEQEFVAIRRSAFAGVDYLGLADPQHQARSAFVEVVDPWACFATLKPE